MTRRLFSSVLIFLMGLPVAWADPTVPQPTAAEGSQPPATVSLTASTSAESTPPAITGEVPPQFQLGATNPLGPAAANAPEVEAVQTRPARPPRLEYLTLVNNYNSLLSQVKGEVQTAMGQLSSLNTTLTSWATGNNANLSQAANFIRNSTGQVPGTTQTIPTGGSFTSVQNYYSGVRTQINGWNEVQPGDLQVLPATLQQRLAYLESIRDNVTQTTDASGNPITTLPTGFTTMKYRLSRLVSIVQTLTP